MRAFMWLVVVVVAFGCLPSAAAVELFWSDDDGIHRFGSDGPGATTLLYDTFETRGITVDAIQSRLLWSDVLPIGTIPT
jgi:hypothetical protein